MSLFTTILLALSYLFSVSSIYAENLTLNVSKYINTERVGEEAQIPGTYNGEWSASIPMGKVMASLERKMKKAGPLGLYPHGKDGKNKPAYIEYTVTFPEGVTLKNDAITTNNTTSMFNTKGITHEINGQSVTFKIPLKDQNWQEIYNLYLADGGANSTKTIDLKIPYSVELNNEEATKKWVKQKITAKGSFEVLARDGLSNNWKKEVYNTDESEQLVAPEYGRHIPDRPLQPPVTVDADLMLGEDTVNHIITKLKTDTMDFICTLDVKQITEQLLDREKWQNISADIPLEDLTTTFTATLTLPKELDFPETDVATLAGAKDKFEFTSITINGQTATVTFKLKDSNKIKSFRQLNDAVSAVGDQLKVILPGVTFKNTAQVNKPYKVTVTIEGVLIAKAINTATNESNRFDFWFDFEWAGKQSQAGASASDPNDIALLVQYVDSSEPSKPIVPNKPSEEPSKPVEPNKPSEEPNKPVEPNKPSEEPNKPVESNKPSEEPSKPVEPTNPSEPVKPETPTETTKVNQPSELPNTGMKSDSVFFLGAMILLLAGTFVIAPKRNI